MYDLVYNSLSDAIICLGTASYLNSLSNYPPTPIEVYSNKLLSVHTQYLEVLNTNKYGLQDTKLLRNNLWVTEPGRTVCEMLEQNFEIEMVLRSIDNFIDKYGENILKDYLNKYNVQDKYAKVIPYLSEIWET